MFILYCWKNITVEDSKGFRLLQVANVVGYIGVFAVNILANALPLNGKTTAELSDIYPNLFVPAGYVFSVWGVIYLLLFAFAIYQASPARRSEGFLGRIGYLFALSCLCNISWIFLWHYEHVILSLLPMFALLLSLILIYVRLDIGRGYPSRGERLFVHLPFSVYLGWITVAPIANVVAALVSINWGGFGLGEVAWTVIMIAVAVVLTVVNTFTRGDAGYALVIVWALAGIAVKQMAFKAIVTAAVTGVIIILAVLLMRKAGPFRHRI
jgi:benzodiazapine receptor